jgi:hypothetical protein
MTSESFKKYELKKLRKHFNIEEFNVGSFRFKKDNLTVDYFPKRKKYFNHNTQERGVLNGSISEYINSWIDKHKDVVETKSLPIQNEERRVFLEWIVKRYKMAQAEIKDAFGTDRKQIEERLKKLKSLYDRENKPSII